MVVSSQIGLFNSLAICCFTPQSKLNTFQNQETAHRHTYAHVLARSHTSLTHTACLYAWLWIRQHQYCSKPLEKTASCGSIESSPSIHSSVITLGLNPDIHKKTHYTFAHKHTHCNWLRYVSTPINTGPLGFDHFWPTED